MGYFGGVGAGRGWHRFKFILTPQEFQDLFMDMTCFFVTTNSRVAINYTFTEQEYVFEGYKQFFDETLIGQITHDRKRRWEIEQPIRTAITDNLNKIAFRNSLDTEGNVSSVFKVTDPLEPVINISPFYLTLTIDESLSVAYMNEEGIIGLELTYPKCVSWKNEGFNVVHETTTFTTTDLFLEFVKRIKKVSHKAKIKSETKTFKPDFWISTSGVSLINQNQYLKKNRLIIE